MKTLNQTLKVGALGALLVSAALSAPASAQPMKMDMAATMKLKDAMDANFDRLFMIHAAMGNMAEVKLGNLALQKSKNPEVRMVAMTTIKGHSAAQKDLATLFRTKAIPMPKDPGVSNIATYEKLSKMSGPAFDKMYIAALVGGHEATITLFEHEIMNGKDEQAKMHAMNKLPGIVGHASMIYDCAIKVKAPGYDLRPRAIIDAAKDASMANMAAMKGM